MAHNYRNCSLHHYPFEFFCEECYEPVCKQCTLIGPHNTQIHVISNIVPAYERRVNEIKVRIDKAIGQIQPRLVNAIKDLGARMEEVHELKQLSSCDNEKRKIKMLMELQRSFQDSVHQINKLKAQASNRLNEINDLCHSFQQLSDSVEIVASHSNLMQSLKDATDRLQILLDKQLLVGQLPKQLSDLRLQLKEIEVYRELIEQKVKIIAQILLKLDQEKKLIVSPAIDHADLLHQLEVTIAQTIQYNVCHYCGIVFSFEALNTICTTNNSALSINEFIGYCKQVPDSTRWATKRHFFGAPKDLLFYFKNRQTHSENSHFRLFYDALLLKLATIIKIKNLKVDKNFKSAAKDEKCNRIAMNYVLVESCGLSISEVEILLCGLEGDGKLFNYQELLDKIGKIDIG